MWKIDDGQVNTIESCYFGWVWLAVWLLRRCRKEKEIGIWTVKKWPFSSFTNSRKQNSIQLTLGYCTAWINWVHIFWQTKNNRKQVIHCRVAGMWSMLFSPLEFLQCWCLFIKGLWLLGMEGLHRRKWGKYEKHLLCAYFGVYGRNLTNKHLQVKCD